MCELFSLQFPRRGGEVDVCYWNVKFISFKVQRTICLLCPSSQTLTVIEFYCTKRPSRHNFGNNPKRWKMKYEILLLFLYKIYLYWMRGIKFPCVFWLLPPIIYIFVSDIVWCYFRVPSFISGKGIVWQVRTQDPQTQK